MGRRDISSHELNQIIKLKEAGASWLKIQQKTEVPRRSAKLVYEKWQQSQPMAELKAARINVATELFMEHLNTLVNLARHVASHLVVPSSTGMSADQFLDTLLGRKILGQENLYHLPQTNNKRESKLVLRYNKLLFKSLQDHTRENIRWEALNEWRMAWDNFIVLCNELQKSAYGIVETNFNEDKKISIRINEEGRNENAVECIADTIYEATLRDIIDDNLGLGEPLVKKSLDADSRTQIITKGFSEKTIFTFVDAGLAEEVLRIFDSAITSITVLVRLNSFNAMRDEIDKMKTAIEELDDMLNPLILRPIIIRTRCDLCPV